MPPTPPIPVPVPEPVVEPVIELTKREKIYQSAKKLLGQHLSADNPGLGCAITVNNIVFDALGAPVGGGASTSIMYGVLRGSKLWERVTAPMEGDIVISPTGTSTYGPDFHGHVGVVLKYGIGSNDSETGLFKENYTLPSWVTSFHARGFPTYYFRAVQSPI